MTRRDFELIAAMIRESRENFASNCQHARFAATVAARLAGTNPRFDRARFIMAAMPAAWHGTRHANVWERIAAADRT
jgi:hypothetical protein